MMNIKDHPARLRYRHCRAHCARICRRHAQLHRRHETLATESRSGRCRSPIPTGL